MVCVILCQAATTVYGVSQHSFTVDWLTDTDCIKVAVYFGRLFFLILISLNHFCTVLTGNECPL